MKVLRDSGLIDWRGKRLTINDFDALAEAADFKPQYLHLRC
jgi:hypothetical protein